MHKTWKKQGKIVMTQRYDFICESFKKKKTTRIYELRKCQNTKLTLKIKNLSCTLNITWKNITGNNNKNDNILNSDLLRNIQNLY